MTVSVALASSYHLQAYDKGLRSRSLGDQLSTVVNTSMLLDDNPFPLFVNQIVVKLADAFREGSNELRLCVSRVLSECHSHLSLVFSRAEVLKKIMIVSHSNDPEARALTLQVLASLAPVFPDNKQVHHLIVETLSTESDLEFKSACHAMAEFTKLSAEFSDTVIPQLWTLLESSETSIKRKSLLIPVFGGMKAMVSTTEKVFSLSHSILETCTHTPLVCSLLEAMTQLAEATRYAIPDQLSILLSALCRAEDNVALAVSALEDLRRLAKHSHVWKDEHLQIVLDIKPQLEERSIIFNKFLRLLIALSQHARPNQMTFFDNILAELITTSTSSDPRQRVSYLHIACNVYCRQPNERFAAKLMNSFVASLYLSYPPELLKQFYRALGDFFCCGHLTEDQIAELLGPLLGLCRVTYRDTLYPRIDLFCRLIDHLPPVVQVIHDWAKETVQALGNELSDSSIAFLLLASGVVVQDSPQNVIPGIDWDRYRVARIAFRNGHWREAALVNLNNIDVSRLSFSSARWINFLQELASAQLSDMSVQAYQQQKVHLTNALSIIDVLLTGIQDASDFRFARNFTNCLIVSCRGILDILSGFSTFQKMPEQYKMPGTTSRLRALIMNAINTLELVISSWNKLIRSSYGADCQTHDYIAILQSMYTIINYGLLCLMNSPSARAAVLPNLRVETTSLKKSLNLLNWANEQMMLINGKPLSESSVNHFFLVLNQLCSQRILIPRFFFQQGDTMKIKLAVVTGNNGEVSVMPGHLYPIQIDGVISSNLSRPVHSITVQAHIQYFIAQSNNTVYSQVVKPKEGLYFQAQFLLAFKQSCEIEFTVEFTDSKALQTWYSDTKASLRVHISE